MALAELYTGGIMPGITQGANLAAQATNIRGAQTKNRLAELALQNAPSEMQARNRLLDLQIQGRESGLAADRQKQGITRLELLSRALSGFGDPSAVEDDAQANELWQAARRALGSAGVDVEGMPETTTAAEVRALAGLASRTGMDASTRNFEYLTRGLSPEEVERARRIELGLDPRAVGSSSVTIARDGLTDLVAGSESAIAGAKSEASERGKLGAQQELLPQVKAAVASAVNEVERMADLDKENRSNARALATYDSAMNNLVSALGGTTTGPGVGLAPALTSNAQIAEGAVAAMAPVLKSIFRVAGEGTFTDRDQALLMNMVPTRSDLPEARAAKVQAIDAIVRAKLGPSSASQQVAEQPQELAPAQPGATRMRYNPETGELEPVG